MSSKAAETVSKMNFNEYQFHAHRTLPERDPGENLAMLALGLAGEVGEVIEMIKKNLYHGHELDYGKLKKEMGDVAWYLACLAYIFRLDLDDIAQANIAKLERRYPDGFSADASRNRTE